MEKERDRRHAKFGLCNYRGIKSKAHTLETFEKIKDGRFRQEVKIKT